MNNEMELFSEHELSGLIQGHEKKMLKEIDYCDPEYFLKANPTELNSYFENEYRINSLLLNKDKITVDNGETEINLKYEYGTVANMTGNDFIEKGSFINFHIPFEGDKVLLNCYPNQFSLSPPRAVLDNNEIIIGFKGRNLNGETIKKELNARLNEIERYINNINQSIFLFNNTFMEKIIKRIEARKKQYLENKGLAASFGFPLKKNENIPATYIVPIERKKIIIKKPEVSKDSFVPEPELINEQYDEILKMIGSMTKVMERSPSAFSHMDEEALRQQFLVPLNANFDGAATGETFNYKGKTDILIRVEGKNIFVAECLIWQGKKYLLEKIDQLLGYTSWRDTKTAILIFNKNKNFSDVVDQISSIVKDHPNFLKQLAYNNESGFRFVVRQNDDKTREMILTVLCFNIPNL